MNFSFTKIQSRMKGSVWKFQMGSSTKRVGYGPLAKLHASEDKNCINSVLIPSIIPCKKSNTEKLKEFLLWQRSQISQLRTGYKPFCNVRGFTADLRSNSTKVSKGSSGCLAHPLQSNAL